ncbi:MAG TPA: thiamine-phosphate kinase [Opitutaceae bacterium]|jgi:thiamine-monophosphate kinase
MLLRSKRGSVSSIGEEALIRRIRGWLGSSCPPSPRGIGDDCAVLPPTRGRGLLTVDPVILGVHFAAGAPARAVGAKLLKRNLSDIAAMGGRPGAAVVALALDGRVSLRWLARFYGGIAAEARRWGIPVVGGDVSQMTGGFCATLALTGSAGARVLARAGARPGDWIYVTGILGRSLRSGHHLAFSPRLAEGRWLAGRAQVRSMIDVSDGLAKDLRALAPKGSEPAVYAEMLPLRGGASAAEALGDGEDYELAFSVRGAGRRALEKAWRRAFPRTRLSCIGRFARRGDVPAGAITLSNHRGYEHLR